MSVRNIILVALAAVAVAAWACGGDDGISGAAPGQGALAIRLKDKPLWFDSVAEVNVFVVRIDARLAEADSAEAEVADDDSTHDAEREGGEHHDGEHGDSARENHHGFSNHEWVTIASPDTVFDLLKLQNGVSAFLGSVVIDTGNFRALRLVIDPSKSSIVLKDGTVLSGDASPFARFPSGERSGIKIELDHEIRVHDGEQTSVIVDFDLEHSFVLRGNLFRNGLLFKPVIHATVGG